VGTPTSAYEQIGCIARILPQSSEIPAMVGKGYVTGIEARLGSRVDRQTLLQALQQTCGLLFVAGPTINKTPNAQLPRHQILIRIKSANLGP
jgi:hypothetical protein